MHVDVLEAFAKALNRESHVLVRTPELAWPQLHNRLQWVGPEVEVRLSCARIRRSRPPAAPWIRVDTAFRESNSLVRTLVGHTAGVAGCAFSPDGKHLVSVGGEGRVWDCETWASLRAVPYGNFCCSFSPDGRRVVTDAQDHALQVWVAATGIEEKTLKGHTDTVTGCAFSPNGRRIVSSSWDCTLMLWDIDTSECLRTFRGHSKAPLGCVFSPDGSRIASFGYDGLRVWDASTGACLRHAPGLVYDCAVSPDGLQIVTAGSMVEIGDFDSGNLSKRLIGYDYFVSHTACAFSPDGRLIASAASDNALKVWDVVTGSEICTLRGHVRQIRSCTFSPDGRWIVSGSDDGVLKVWDVSAGRGEPVRPGHTAIVKACSFSPDGRVIVTASADQALKVWDAVSGVEERVLMGHDRGGPHWEGVLGCAISPDGRFAVSAGADCTVRVWSMATGECLRTLVGHTDTATSCAFSPDGRWIASTGGDQTLRLWDAHTGAEVRCLRGHSGMVRDCAFSPDAERVVSTSWGALKLWDVSTGACESTVTIPARMLERCAFSPDGLRLAVVVSGSGGCVQLRDPRTGALEWQVQCDTWWCAFSADGHLIAAADGNHVVVWDVRTRDEVARVALPGQVMSGSWHPFEARLSCGDFGGALHRATLIGYDLGPVVVSAASRGTQITVRCPNCQQEHPIDRAQLGQAVICPASNCNSALQLNDWVLPSS